MLCEYAIEPELVVTWLDRKIGRYFLDALGKGSPRIMSGYARKHWKRLIWFAWEKSSNDNQLDRKRLEEIVKKLAEVTVKRHDAIWNSERGWLENAVNEHQRISFHAILARSNSTGHSKILVAEELDEQTSLWAIPRGLSVQRTAEAIAGAVRDMLRAATDIIFIDPYFAPQRPRYVTVLAACLRACLDQRVASGCPNVRIVTSDDSDRNGTPDFFEKACRRYLPGILPFGLTVTICRVRERPGGEKLHNRYILTELGGVSFGAGLAEAVGTEGATDDLNLLARGQYEERWRQYAGEPPEFDQHEGDIRIVGTDRNVA